MKHFTNCILIFILCLFYFALDKNADIFWVSTITGILFAFVILTYTYFLDKSRFTFFICCLYGIFTLVSPTATAFLPIALYCIVRQCHRNITALYLLFTLFRCMLCGNLYNLTLPNGASVYLSLYIFILCIFSVHICHFANEHEKLIEHSRQFRDDSTEINLLLKEKNKSLLTNQDYEINNATLMERNRIAREIHDTLGHTMTGLSAGIDACIALIDYSVDETKKQLSIISGVARQGLKDVRRSMKKLRPDTLERESLESAIEQLITETMSTSKVSIEFQSFLPSLVFEDDEEDTIYRIVQEGITNAIRHGHASRIFINFKKVDIWLVIRIRDNGIGCKDIHKGFGLTHMKERVDMLHGTVTYSSNNGFQVVAKLPIRWRNEER